MLEIDRLSLHVRAAAVPERAERLARRLRDAALRGIERDRYALSPQGAPAYLFVERLAVHCAVRSDWDDAAIGAEVARALAAALEHSVALPQTMAFRDRVELLAAFYAALAEGRAWQRWWFEAFDGLRPLSASAALRTSVMTEEPHGLAALARLTATAFASVARTLTAGDAARLLAWLEGRRSARAAAPVALWKASASLPAQQDDVALLRVLVAAERNAPGAANGETLRVLRAMKALRTAVARAAFSTLRLAAGPPHEALRALLAQLGLEADWLQSLAESDAARIVEELLYSKSKNSPPPRESSADEERPASSERLATSRGGVFVLLKALDWLGWPAQWARGTEPELARAFAWAVALRALEPRGAQGLRDAAITQAFALEQPLAILRSRRHAVLRKRVTPTARELLEEFSRRVPGLAGASPGYLRRNALALPATVERRDDGCIVRLGRAPLDILLVLAGAKSGRIALPGGARLELRAEAE